MGGHKEEVQQRTKSQKQTLITPVCIRLHCFKKHMNPQDQDPHPQTSQCTTITKSPFSIFLSMNTIPETDEFPRGPHSKQCGLCLYSSPTSLACLEPSVGPAPVLIRPAGSYEMGLSSQTNFAYDPCRKQIKWKSYPCSQSSQRQ